ncbi:MAG: KH domain-containing protein [Candidatus Woesearchaeota archaeon]
MSGFLYAIRVPKERIPVIIGTSGTTKNMLQETLGVSLDIDSEEGDIQITGEDALKLFVAREVIKAIGRGFNPDIALDLQKQDFALEIIELKDYANTRKALLRKRGRVIGEKGRARSTIENLTDTKISVYGKTIGIIGRVEDANAARRAVEALLEEATHAGVYKTLEKHRAEQRKKEALWIREDIPEELKD